MLIRSKAFALLLLVVISSYSLSAQDPGYIGKRFSILAVGNVGIQYNVFDMASSNDRAINFTPMFGGSLEYAISPTSAIGVTLMRYGEHYQPGVDYDYVFSDAYYKYLEFHDNIMIYSLDHIKFNSGMYGVGGYRKLSLQLFQHSSSDVASSVIALDGTPDGYQTAYFDKVSYFDFGLQFGFGRRWIIKDMLILDFGVSFGAPHIMTFMNGIKNEFISDGVNNDEIYEFKTVTGFQGFLTNITLMQLKIGIIP